MKIVAIGGGHMGEGQTLALDSGIVELTGKRNPRALFLPTASFDSREYWQSFETVYGSLGCDCSALFLWDGYSQQEIDAVIERTKMSDSAHHWEFRGDIAAVRPTIESTDIIYVGGGNTRRMLELWRSAGVDEMLGQAGERGAVLCGLSAGCICWGRYGNSDAALTENTGELTMRVDGLGFIDLALCPHYDGEPYRPAEFARMMSSTPGTGLGLEDCCALEISGERFRIITCREGAKAHVLRENGRVCEVVEPSHDFRRLAELA